MNDQARYKLKQLGRYYFLLRTAEFAVLSLGFAFVVYSLLDWWQVETVFIKILISMLSGVSLLILLFYNSQLHRLDNHSYTRFLNQAFPQLKESADLMLFDEHELTGLQQLQRIKTIEQFNLIYPSIRLPHHLVRSFIILVISCLVYFITSSFSESRKSNGTNSIPAGKLQMLNQGAQAISIRSLSMVITPPEYTGLKTYKSDHLDLHFPEGSNIRWQFQFSGKPKEVKLIFSAKDSANLKFDGDYFLGKKYF